MNHTTESRLASAVFTHWTPRGTAVAAVIDIEPGVRGLAALGTFEDPVDARRHRQAVIDAVLAIRRQAAA